MLGAERVLADQMGLEVLDDALHREFAPGQSALADARDSLVRVDDDKEEVACTTPDGQALDVRDLHGRVFPLPDGRRSRRNARCRPTAPGAAALSPSPPRRVRHALSPPRAPHSSANARSCRSPRPPPAAVPSMRPRYMRITQGRPRPGSRAAEVIRPGGVANPERANVGRRVASVLSRRRLPTPSLAES